MNSSSLPLGLSNFWLNIKVQSLFFISSSQSILSLTNLISYSIFDVDNCLSFIFYTEMIPVYYVLGLSLMKDELSSELD